MRRGLYWQRSKSRQPTPQLGYIDDGSSLQQTVCWASSSSYHSFLQLTECRGPMPRQCLVDVFCVACLRMLWRMRCPFYCRRLETDRLEMVSKTLLVFCLFSSCPWISFSFSSSLLALQIQTHYRCHWICDTKYLVYIANILIIILHVLDKPISMTGN